MEAESMIHRLFHHDPDTHDHSFHVMQLVQMFYTTLPDHFRNRLDCETMLNVALLHDVGKCLIPEHIINKPAALDADERKRMEQHTHIGKGILSGTRYRHLCEKIACHHERIDGNGYFGLPAHAIPLESKIIAIADTYSALTSNRCYRQRHNDQRAYTILYESAGTQLDEELTFLFCRCVKSMQEVRQTAASSCVSLSGKQAYAENQQLYCDTSTI